MTITPIDHNGRPIEVGSLVRHVGGGTAWRVGEIRDHDGRPGLSLVSLTESNLFTAFYADRAVVIEETPNA